MAILNETRTYRKIDRTLHGDTTYLRGIGEHKNVFSFAIGTAENPRGNELSKEENAKRMAEFTETLRRNRLHYYKTKGKYEGVKENSLFIANVNLKQCEYWFGPERYNQNAFIFGTINPETHEVNYSYYEQNRGKFEKSEEKTTVIKTDDADNFSNIAGYKFRIPFFEEAIADVSNSLEESYGWNPEYRNYSFEFINRGDTIPNLWRFACTHFLTEEQELGRLKRLGIVSQNAKTLSEAKGSLREEIIQLYKL